MNKYGLYLQKADFSLDKFTSEKHELRLLASGDGVEVMLQEIASGITFDICPPDEECTLMEFFYVLDGSIQYFDDEGNECVLKEGDYFFTKKLTKLCLFKTLSKIKLIYVSSQPIFHNIGDSMRELHKINLEIDQKDKYTHSHSERVRDYAVKIALEMQLSRDKIAALAIASLFHDVGKIYVNDYILQKPGKLTDEEYEIVKLHPLKSAQHVRNIKYVDVAKIVEQHHERIDGSGYPNGLKGDEISIEAKIIAVADTFDAMTSDRPYRKAIPVDLAVEEIRRLAGSKYDREVVDYFITTIEKEKVRKSL